MVITPAETYGYRPEDITVLKDHRDLPVNAQPTRANMVRDSISLQYPAIRIEAQRRFAS